jgi:hypothetical protein
MAHRDHDRNTVYGAAVGLLALGVTLHYGWALVPPEHAAQIWNAVGAVARAALLLWVAFHIRHPAVTAVTVWWLIEEALVAGCSAAYIIKPWPVPVGQAQCSSLFHLDLGTLGAVVIMILVGCIAVMSYRWQDE